MNSTFGYLYARPSLIEGVGRIMDFGNSLNVYNETITPEQADFLAMLADWRVVGSDIQSALGDLDKELVDHDEDVPQR